VGAGGIIIIIIIIITIMTPSGVVRYRTDSSTYTLIRYEGAATTSAVTANLIYEVRMMVMILMMLVMLVMVVVVVMMVMIMMFS
jgi:hypothetical protein